MTLQPRGSLPWAKKLSRIEKAAHEDQIVHYRVVSYWKEEEELHNMDLQKWSESHE